MEARGGGMAQSRNQEFYIWQSYPNVISIKMKEKLRLPDKQKLRIHSSNTCPVRNTERESFQEKQRVLDSKSNSHKDLRNTSNGNHTARTSVLRYSGLVIPGLSNNVLTAYLSTDVS